jgi:hypothetical protein
MSPQDMLQVVQDVRDEFQREEDQGLLQRDMHKAEQALAGKYACDRIARRVEARAGFSPFPARAVARGK